MSEKRSQYDTDPLDPDFVRRTEEIMSGGGTPTTDVSRERPTERIAQPHLPSSEDPTRRLDEATRKLEDPASTAYPSVFVPPVYQPPANYTSYGANVPPGASEQPRIPYSGQGKPTARPIPKLGLPENIALVLPYAPFYIGAVAAIVELLLVPRNEYRVRFHAAQGLALQLAILAISFLFWLVAAITGSGLGSWLFWMTQMIFLIVSIVRIWEGKEHRIAPLADATSRINQQFEPRK